MIRRKAKHIWLATVLWLGLLSPCYADLKNGFDAYWRGDFATAVAELRPHAEQGNATAQFYLGWMYGNGEGVSRDYAVAVRWYRLAAEQGLGLAQFNLAISYNAGRGVPEDRTEALKWFRQAAEHGVAEAQFVLGNIYGGRGAAYANPEATEEDLVLPVFGPLEFAGLGVPPDHIREVQWLRKAAEQGYVRAQYILGVLYSPGSDLPSDYVQAYMWLRLVEMSNDPEWEKLGSYRGMFVDRMTSEEIAEAERLANEWLERHAAEK